MSRAATAVGIRPATAPDAGAIAAIHNQGIAERSATFDAEDVTPEDVGAWLGDERAPVLAAEVDGRVAGWARVIRSGERCALVGVGEYAGEWKDLLIVQRLLGEAAGPEA